MIDRTRSWAPIVDAQRLRDARAAETRVRHHAAVRAVAGALDAVTASANVHTALPLIRPGAVVHVRLPVRGRCRVPSHARHARVTLVRVVAGDGLARAGIAARIDVHYAVVALEPRRAAGVAGPLREAAVARDASIGKRAICRAIERRVRFATGVAHAIATTCGRRDHEAGSVGQPCVARRSNVIDGVLDRIDARAVCPRRRARAWRRRCTPQGPASRSRIAESCLSPSSLQSTATGDIITSMGANETWPSAPSS